MTGTHAQLSCISEQYMNRKNDTKRKKRPKGIIV